MPDRPHVCVFCGSLRGSRPAYTEAARRTGWKVMSQNKAWLNDTEQPKSHVNQPNVQRPSRNTCWPRLNGNGTTWAMSPSRRIGPSTAAMTRAACRQQAWPWRAMGPTNGPVMVANVVRMTGLSLTLLGGPELTARQVRTVNGTSRPRRMYQRRPTVVFSVARCRRSPCAWLCLGWPEPSSILQDTDLGVAPCGAGLFQASVTS